MEFFDVIENRRSVRSFQKKEVEEEKINKILDTANRAPSAGDLQAYEIVLIKDLKTKRMLCQAALGQGAIEQANVVLVFFANPKKSEIKYGRRGATLYSIQDATIACAHAQLAVHALGLVCVWIGAFDDNKVKKILHAPEDLKPIAILSIGYAAEKPYPTPRRAISDLVHKERF